MRKKGLNYIDWVISLGTFLIAVIAIFVFLRPGSQDVTGAENLAVLVESNFLEETTWTMKQAPLFVKRLVDTYRDENNVPRPAEVEMRISSDWALNMDSVSSGDVLITGGAGQYTVKCTRGLCTDTTFMLTYYPSDRSHTDLSQLRVECTPNDKDDCNVEIGASEDITGISVNQLNTFKNKDYEQLKESWSFPANKEFVVYVDNLKVTKGPDAYEQSNVLVREVHAHKVLSTGERVPVVVNIRVW
jgi:hypothetical protein